MLLTGQPTTHVINSTAYPPIEGREYRLTCDITDGNPKNPDSFRWEGETSTQMTLVISSLDRAQHTKTFRCAAANSAGDGVFGEGLDVLVWCKSNIQQFFPTPMQLRGSLCLT